MFSGRWKNQNSKIKVMFQLQFQATQVPKMKGKGLMIALIPAETGKPIAKSEKAPIVDGICTWNEPIYEMVKLVKHQKTETYKEKIYYFNVQTGSSSKSGFVGEVGVDFANFAESNEPLQLSLPLTASDSGAILHVFIQKMQRTDEQRDLEENESLQSESVRSKNQTSDCSDDFAEDVYLTRVDSEMNKDPKLQNNRNFNEQSTVKKNGQRSSNDWSGSLSDRSVADLLNSPESKNTVEVLKIEVSRLERQAELSDIELESLRKQILKENKRGQELSRKIDELREDKLGLETECDQLKSSHNQKQELNETIKGLHAEIEIERKEKAELKNHIEEIEVDYKFLLDENDNLSSQLEESQIEQTKIKIDYSKSLTTIKQYEIQVKRLEEKITNQAFELSQSLDSITEYESHIKSLEKELDQQGRDFEDDVADLMKVKIEQEERVVQAEEALRKSKLVNANAIETLKEAHEQEVEKLRDQIKQMSMELEIAKKHGENEDNNRDLEFEALKKENEKMQKESVSLMSEKNVIIRTLQSELKRLRGDYNEFQERLLIIESEKVNLKKEVSRLETTTMDQQKHLNLLKESKVVCDVTSSKHDESISKLESAKRNDEEKVNKLLREISSLNEKNKHMESELKEMQEKYSEVSLRFAEVEGERQQLVMALRNLRNGKK